MTATQALKLYGTDEKVSETKLLQAGPLTAEFEAGALRYIRYKGHELVRAISYIVRDPQWGTYNPSITRLAIEEQDGSFQLSFRGHVKDGQSELDFDATITAEATGRLRFHVDATPKGDFSTNRTGFVILHPILGVMGEPVEIEHCDGQIEKGHFPTLINPVQPMMDLRALNTTPRQGLDMRILMEGDAFEMEDQRNWTDASYKTYVRPLARPWPYDLTEGKTFSQTITLLCTGDCAPAVVENSVTIDIAAKSAGVLPGLGQAVTADIAESIDGAITGTQQLGLSHLLLRHDPQRGDNAERLLSSYRRIVEIDAAIWLELVVQSVDEFDEELAELGAFCKRNGLVIAGVMVTPEADLNGTLPGSQWPPAPPARALLKSAREAFPDAIIGGGVQAFFTELNRKRPPLDELDMVGFTTSAVVHAGDDRSILESLQTLPMIISSAKEIAGDNPVFVGPCNIGMRANPYGDAPKDNPENIRVAMCRNDPRQRGLFGAAWAIGCYAQLAHGGAARVTMGAPHGAFGCQYAISSDPQPWFDEHGGYFPVYHAYRALAALEGCALHSVKSSAPEKVLAVAGAGKDGIALVLANLTPNMITVDLGGTASQVAVLDCDGFEQASQDVDWLWKSEFGSNNHSTSKIELKPFAIVRAEVPLKLQENT